MSDFIRVKDLALTVSFSDGSRWPSSTPHAQPVVVTCSIAHDVRRAAATDDLTHSVNYSAVASNIKAVGDAEVFPSIEAFADRICETHARRFEAGALTLSIARTKALLYGASFGLEFTKADPHAPPQEETFFLRDLACYAVLGIHPHERQRKQSVRIDVCVTKMRSRAASLDYRTLEQRIFDYVQDSKFLTVESLASEVAKLTLTFLADATARATVRISKPSALLTAEASELEVTRSFADLDTSSTDSSGLTETPNTPVTISKPTSGSKSAGPSSSLPHRAAIAIGGNMGDRFANIECALRLLEAPGADIESWTGEPRVIVVDTSFMYETAPMYVAEQPRFINCACVVETDLEPRALLTFLKQVESAVGRVESFRNGPRAIDLDIILYDSLVMDTRPESARATLDNLSGELLVPHPRLGEREFVLRPLADMIPNYIIPTTGKTVEESLSALMAQPSADPIMYKVLPFPRYPLPNHEGERPAHMSKIRPVPPTATYWSFPVSSHASSSRPPPRKTYIMATLNATPDSFSDGSAHYSLPDALSYANSAVADGANIIDIGGYSTRPGAAYVSPEEEFSRVVPVVQAIRGLWQEGAVTTPGGRLPSIARTASTLISVDTFRWEVAEESVHAGANCINDVYAFSGADWPATARSAEHFKKMRQVSRDLAVPVILMHSRGPASANKDYSQYDYAVDHRDGRGAVLEGVRIELGAKVEAAIKGRGGIRRWLVLVDPGLGFSKTVEGNLEVLRDAATVVGEYSPRLRALTAPPSRPTRNPLAGYPMLLGASRKSFLGAILERPDPVGSGNYEGRQTRPVERDFATAAAVSCAVQQGATVVRVHDVLRLGDAVRASSALWS
ncbi:Dihydropteroate synthase [Trametes versicolor FP-101664 SS1]|uniref:Dihydropteroate synthase n=1 Tax=Trametes versicolor (strain FP-101664) TaxID=717944 RepID=UPI0004622B1D|nr:Dihydropteroate synthase [Trametes versicolor FP-101664 SS1]EIW53425.1 Dihydropteroate synthase [Trametes versicolor FP-101664 SS1]